MLTKITRIELIKISKIVNEKRLKYFATSDKQRVSGSLILYRIE